ncbi:MAG: putative toxin-antitoxin system toxin component, PIN family [Syntrophorhabdaceae bacterium]|nr:putative toxin-antitoxin system toxin component, PIN family [Syntrophorhabdaceae bacterium]MDD5244599.1 putative toxin-antitoxin system toxin component, PIN family [Syntrophorhabdaceae bacterium]
MKIVLDTNVFISGIFFTGPPHRILEAWRDGKIQLVISPEILAEYSRVGKILAEEYPLIDVHPMIDLVTVEAELYNAQGLLEPVCSDPDDDKFLACAIAGGSKIIVSGDKHLLKVSGFQGIEILKPQEFTKRYLQTT